jgi:hypothetical protein
MLETYASFTGIGMPQGCSTLFVVVHIAQGFEAPEGNGVAILGDGVGLIEPQDIISEAAQPGLVQLPYGDMIEYAEGTAGDPAKIFAWAQAKVREAGDAV